MKLNSIFLNNENFLLELNVYTPPKSSGKVILSVYMTISGDIFGLNIHINVFYHIQSGKISQQPFYF